MRTVDDANERPYNILERLIFYTVPLVFALALTGALLTFFGFDVMRPVLQEANRIPFLRDYVPDPAPLAIDTATEEEQPTVEPTKKLTQALAASERLVKAKDEAIIKLTKQNDDREKVNEKLQADLKTAQAKKEEQRLTAEQYNKRVKDLASLYAAMSPSKAAPILEKLTLSERVLLLHAMKPSEQVDILEKMTPETAAASSILLKDVVKVEALQVAALQERLGATDKQATDTAVPAPNDPDDVYAQMQPKQAAEVLLALAANDITEVSTILKRMQPQSRAAILNQLADKDTMTTAKIAAQL